MKSKIINWLLISLSSFGLAYAADEDRFRTLETLSLSSEQKQQIENIKNEQQTQIKALQADLKSEQNKLKALQNNENFSEEQAYALKNKINSIQSSLSDVKVKSWLKVKAVLNPEQNKKLRNLQLSH